jgi:hypothetical protein
MTSHRRGYSLLGCVPTAPNSASPRPHIKTQTDEKHDDFPSHASKNPTVEAPIRAQVGMEFKIFFEHFSK